MQPHEYWQNFHDPDNVPGPPYHGGYPARLPDGRVLLLPIRRLAGTESAIASLILNQTAFAVEAAIADHLAERFRSLKPDIIAGMPTLGLSLARAVAVRLGHRRYVALGTSRKFWYDDALSVPMQSITSPAPGKRLYLDPRMRPLLENARVGVIDDVISSGTSMAAGLDLMQIIGITPVAAGAAMLQTRRWEELLERRHPATVKHVTGVFETPLLSATGGGWEVS